MISSASSVGCWTHSPSKAAWAATPGSSLAASNQETLSETSTKSCVPDPLLFIFFAASSRRFLASRWLRRCAIRARAETPPRWRWPASVCRLSINTSKPWWPCRFTLPSEINYLATLP